eukprot:gene36786-46198_t
MFRELQPAVAVAIHARALLRLPVSRPIYMLAVPTLRRDACWFV